MSQNEQVLQLINEKIKGLDIYLHIFNNTKKYEIDDCSELINIYEEFKNILGIFKGHIEQDKLNTNFIIYLNSLLSRIGFAYSGKAADFANGTIDNTRHYYEQINKRSKNETLGSFSQISFALKTIEKLKFYNDNMVFIGANGAGKSSFANDLKKHFNNHCVAISAQRILNIPINAHIENIEHVRQQLKNKQTKDISNKESNYINILTDEFSILLKNLFSDNHKVAHNIKKSYQDGKLPENIKSIMDSVIEVWNKIIIHRILESKDGMNLIVKTHQGQEYDANKMSDGEKVVLFCVGQVLLAPKNSFVIVDEPELFLNKNIVNKLWDELEIIRSDCKFIYLTHELDFAINRSALKFWIKSYDDNGFEFEEIENNEMPPALVMELLGSQNPILFCEGKNDGKSYDVKLLSLLLSHFNIKAVESCNNVINYTKAFNRMNNVSIKAYGLIDSDFHTSERLDALELDNIFNFCFSEIENLCLDEALFQEFATSISAPANSFESMKNKIFAELESQKIMQASYFVSSKIDYYYKDSHISKSKTKAELQTNFNNFNQPIAVENWFNGRVEEINSIIATKNYVKAIQIFNNKGLVKKANESLLISDYIDRLIRYIGSNKAASAHLLKYFHCKLKEF